MRLAAKLVMLFLVGMLLIVALFFFLMVQQDRQLAMTEHQRHAADLADAVQRSIPAEPSERGSSEQSDQQAEEPSQRIGWTALTIRETQIRLVEPNSRDEAYRPTVPPQLIIASRQATTILRHDESGQAYFHTYLPVDDDPSEPGHDRRLEISSPDPDADQRVRRSLMSSLIALLGVACLSGLVIIIGGIKMVARPLNKLIDKVHRIGDGDFSQPVQLKSRDELGRLGEAINEMCQQLDHQRERLETETASRIEAVEQLRHAERLNMVGRMAAGIAHEIGTPLNVVSGRAELIASGMLSEEAIRESAKTIQSESQRITKIVRNLLDFARQSTPQRSRQDLHRLISVTTALMEPLAAKHHTELKLNLPDSPLSADIDPSQIQQVLTNLIVNAIQTIKTEGQVTIALERIRTVPPGKPSSEPQPFCRIAVTDNGSGIPSQDLDHIFEPFFTTKDVGEGTGLGLSISHGIIQEHQGWIEVESEEGKGSTFAVYLPAPEEHDSETRETTKDAQR